MGIGDKLTHGEPTGELALRVYVEKKKAKAKVANPVPKVVVVPGVGERITDVIELGRVVPELFTERVRPAMPGSGLGHTAVTVGTFGCLVRRKGDSTGLYVLSNAHVLANEGMAAPGDGIVQPGSLDGGTSDGDSFARLTDFVPFEFTDTSFPNLVDAAIAKVRRRTWVGPKLRILDIAPAGVSKTVRRGMHIKKVGRTTDYTTGVISDVHLRLALRYHRPSGSGRGTGRVQRPGPMHPLQRRWGQRLGDLEQQRQGRRPPLCGRCLGERLQPDHPRSPIARHRGRVMASRNHVQRAIELYEDELARYPNVTGIGVVPVTDDPDGPADLAVAVYVTRKVPRDELKAGERIPPTLEIPSRDGAQDVPTRVIATGEFALEDQFDIEPA